MKLVFDGEALADIEDIFEWIAQDSPVIARSVADRLLSSAELLITFPFMGHAGGDPGTLEWVLPRLPYIIVYEVDREQDVIIVTAVLHAAQDRKHDG